LADRVLSAGVPCALRRWPAWTGACNHVLKFRGKTPIPVEWAEELGIKPGTSGARRAKRWPVAKALTKPVAQRARVTPWPPRRLRRVS
jgi:hypothetical protein